MGAKLRKVRLENDVTCWSVSPSKYDQEAVRNCQSYLKANFPEDSDFDLIKNAPNPFPLGYEPCMDISRMLTPEEASYFQTIIGVMRWMVELGRIDITTEVSQLSSFLAMPREGHLINALQNMSHLRWKHNSPLVLDPFYPNIDMSAFKSNEDWKAFYGDAKEAMPPLTPLNRWAKKLSCVCLLTRIMQGIKWTVARALAS